MPDSPRPTIDAAQTVAKRLRDRLRAAVKGRDDVINLLLVGLLADGHVLLEDYPGSGKTTLARALGAAIDDTKTGFPPFRRIQFTPDLLPSDITGTSVFEPATGKFTFRRGPLFAHIVLADEINRTSPKVQAALLEAMAEKQVTVDETTHPLDALFFVVATQNPMDVAGTYPLPTPQLDRFLFRIRMEHVARAAELEVLAAYPEPTLETAAKLPGVTREELLAARESVRKGVALVPLVRESLVDLARAIRADARVMQGASTRSLVLMMPALQAHAVLAGRDHVAPEDVEALAPHVFAHRIEVAPGVDDPREVVAEHVKDAVERLAKASL